MIQNALKWLSAQDIGPLNCSQTKMTRTESASDPSFMIRTEVVHAREVLAGLIPRLHFFPQNHDNSQLWTDPQTRLNFRPAWSAPWSFCHLHTACLVSTSLSWSSPSLHQGLYHLNTAYTASAEVTVPSLISPKRTSRSASFQYFQYCPHRPPFLHTPKARLKAITILMLPALPPQTYLPWSSRNVEPNLDALRHLKPRPNWLCRNCFIVITYVHCDIW